MRSRCHHLLESLLLSGAAFSIGYMGVLPGRADTADWVRYHDFANVSNLQLNGNAAGSGARLRLTPALNSQAGSAFLKDRVRIDPADGSFETAFSFEITTGGSMADGLCFVLQNDANGASALGGAGGAKGLTGGVGGQISPHVAVEFNDYNQDTVMITTNEVRNGVQNVTIDDGTRRYCWVDYDGATLSVYLATTSSKPGIAVTGLSLDVLSVLGTNEVWAGFTAGTGGQNANHDILHWVFNSPPKVDNAGGATAVGVATATLGGYLHETNGVTDAWVYWGPTDGMTNKAAWSNAASQGQAAIGALSASVGGLSAGTQYYYRYHASNAAWTAWAESSSSFSTLPAYPLIDSSLGSGVVTATSAWLRATLTSTGTAPTEVWSYWGGNDAGTGSAWAAAHYFGTNTAAVPVAYSNNVTGLTPGVPQYYRFLAVNAHGSNWSDAVRFTPVGVPAVNNSSGATPDLRRALLAGTLTAGVAADVTVFWGDSDGGTGRANWANAVVLTNISVGEFSASTTTDLLYGVPYYYRCYATNSVGDAWAPWTAVFLSKEIANRSIFYQDFEGGGTPYTLTQNANPPPAAVQSGGGTGIDHYLRLEYQSGGVRNAIAFDQASDQISPGDSLTIEFDFRMDGGADGMGFLLTPTSTYGTSGTGAARDPEEEPNISGLFGIGFDLWQDINEVSAHWNGAVASVRNLDPVSELDLNANQWHHARVDLTDPGLDSDVRLTLTLTPDTHGVPGKSVLAFDDVGLAGFDSLYSYRVEFGGRTGGVTHNGDLDNFRSTPPHLNLGISNIAATNVTVTAATLRAGLHAGGAAFDVYACWGTTDGGTNAGAWAQTELVGSYADVASTNIDYALSGLNVGVDYSYTFFASNAATVMWASSSMSFATLGAPVVDNGTGATPGFGEALINGALTAGGRADIVVYWGAWDGSTNTMGPGVWEHTNTVGEINQGPFTTRADGLLYGRRYYYRCYATNTMGSDWADATASFTTLNPALDTRPPVTSDLVFRLDAQDVDGDGNQGDNPAAGPISRWNDATSNHVDFVSTGADPSYVVGSGPNGKNFVAFTNSNDNSDRMIMETATTGDRLAGAGLNTVSTFIVVHFHSGVVWFQWDNGTRHSAEGAERWDFGNTTHTAWDGNNILATGWHLLELRYDANMLNVYVDGANVKTVADAGLAVQTGSSRMGIGGRNDNIGTLQAVVDFAEFCHYNVALTTSAREAMGGYLSRKYGLTTAYPEYQPPRLGIANTSPSGIASNSAVINADLDAAGSVFDVWAHWGETDGGTDPAAWQYTAHIGSYTNVMSAGLSHTATGLVSGLSYSFTFSATNAATNMWATPSTQFQTAATPAVSNTPPLDITESSATLRGDLVAGGSGEVMLYWGMTDGNTDATVWSNAAAFGTLTAGPFSTNVAVLAGARYYYRCYATNRFGHDWADYSVTFTTPPATLAIGDATVIEGDSGTTDMAFDVVLSAPSVSNVWVDYHSADLTATADTDYLSASGTLVVAAGQTTTQITLTVIGDLEDELPSEAFLLNLIHAVGATVSDGQAVGTITDDDADTRLRSWAYKMKVTFSGYNRNETLTNFPALVQFSESNLTAFAYSQFAGAGGEDLRFANARQTDLLNYEIEEWNADGTSFVWVQVPELSEEAHIWAYWGNPAAVENTVTAATDIAGCVVWFDANDTDADGIPDGLVDGTTVATWKDKSGNNRSASAGAAPTKESSAAINNMPLLQFDAADYLYTAPFSAEELAGPNRNELTTFYVMKRDGGGVWTKWETAGNNRVGFEGGNRFDFVNDSVGQLQGGDVTGSFVIHSGAKTPTTQSTYVNGVLSASKANNLALTPGSASYVVGANDAGGGLGSDIDFAEIIIYNRALSPAEQNRVGHYLARKYGLVASFENPDAPPYTRDGSTWSAGYVGVWHLGEKRGAAAPDATANDLTGALQNMQDSDWVRGRIANGLNFDGTQGSDSIEVAHNDVMNVTDAISISTWLKSDDWDGNQRILQKGNADDQYRFLDQGDLMMADIEGVATVTSPLPSSGAWHHTAVTYDGSAVRLFIDGTMVHETAASGSIATTANMLYIGTKNTAAVAGDHFDGILDEVRICGVARSPDWVWACWKNQGANHASFVHYGSAQETRPSGMLIILR